jgi:hypothetical protein
MWAFWILCAGITSEANGGDTVVADFCVEEAQRVVGSFSDECHQFDSTKHGRSSLVIHAISIATNLSIIGRIRDDPYLTSVENSPPDE